MARKTGATPAPRSKREAGYTITVRGWLPVDTSDVAAFKATLDLIEEANGGDYSELLKLMQRMEFSQKFTTRTVKADAPAT